MRPFVLAATAFLNLGCAAHAVAQLTVALRSSFVDSRSGGNGNIGVCQDEVQGHFFVIDFSNAMTIHEFDPAGNFLREFTTTTCTPAAPSPNDIAYDPIHDRLWVVDNTPNLLLSLDRNGVCSTGWTFSPPTSNPAGLAFNRNTGTLLVGSSNRISEWSLQGVPLSGGFIFLPPTGSSFLNGVAHVPSNDHILVAQSGGTQIFEFDPIGLLISTTDLASFGVTGIQGLAYNAVNRTLIVVDGNTSTVTVFDARFCQGNIIRRGTACVDNSGVLLRIDALGCPDRGQTFEIGVATGLSNSAPYFLIFGLSDTNLFGIPLPFDLGVLGRPNCTLYTSQEAILGPLPNTLRGGRISVVIPNDPTIAGGATHWQGVQLGPPLTMPLPLIASDFFTIAIG